MPASAWLLLLLLLRLLCSYVRLRQTRLSAPDFNGSNKSTMAASNSI